MRWTFACGCRRTLGPRGRRLHGEVGDCPSSSGLGLTLGGPRCQYKNPRIYIHVYTCIDLDTDIGIDVLFIYIYMYMYTGVTDSIMCNHYLILRLISKPTQVLAGL